MGEKTIFIGYPIDKAAGKQSGNLIQPGQIVLGIGANSGYKEEAWEYIKMFFEEEYQSTINGKFPVSRSELEKRLIEIIQSADSTSATDWEMYNIALEEVAMFLSGDRSAEDTAEVIQRRLSMYVAEKQ